MKTCLLSSHTINKVQNEKSDRKREERQKEWEKNDNFENIYLSLVY